MGQVNMLDRLRYFTAAFAVGYLMFANGLELENAAVAQEAFDTVINVSGKLKEFDVRRNVITVTREDGTDVFVMAHEDPTRLLFSANAKPEWIRVGMLVRIEAMFGPAGTPLVPIDNIELLEPFQAGKANPHVRERYMPGVYPVDPKPNNQQGQQAGFQAGNYRVIGTIAGMDRTGIMVNAGETRVPLPIAADAKWLIRYHSFSLAEPGDTVTVNGFHQPPDETKIKANNVQISVDRLYGEQVPKVRPKKRTRATSPKEEAKPKPEEAAPLP